MGLFDFLGDVLVTPFDMLGVSRHSRDQEIEQQNQRNLMSLENQYHQENFDREFAAENAEWQRRYDETQSPEAQARQYRQIGINPSAMLQNGNGGFHQAVVQPSSPSPANIAPPSQGSIYQGGNSTDLLGDIAKMELNEAQRDEIYSLLHGKIREQEDAHELAQIMRAQKEFTLGLDKVYGSDERANKLANLVQEGLVLYLRGQEAEKNAKFLEAQSILANDEHVLNKQQLPLLKLYLEAMIQATKARASESYAFAESSHALAKLNSLETEIKRNMQGAIEGSLFEDWQNKVKNGNILNWQIDAAKSAAEIARVSASHAEALFWKDFIIDIFDSGIDAFTSVKNAKSWANMSENQKANVDRKLEEMKWKYGDNVSIESRTPSGGKKVRTFRRPYSKYKDSTD